MAWCWSAPVMDQAPHGGHILYFLFSGPWSRCYYLSEVCQRWPVSHVTSSKSGWVTTWWKMPNTYIASPHLLLHVHLPPDQPLSAMPISLPWDVMLPQRHWSLFTQQQRAGKAVADKQETLFPSGGLLLPRQPHSAEQSSWKTSCPAKKDRRASRGQRNCFYLFIFLIYHTLVTSLVFPNLTNRLPRTQSIWLSSANKLFAMCLLSKKTCCPRVTILKRTLVNMFYQLIIIIKKKNSPVFFSQLFIKCLQKPDSESASLSNFCFYQCKCSQICYWRAVQEQLGCWHSSYSFFKGFCSEYKEADSEIIHGLKVKHILNYFAALKPKAFALKQNHTKAAWEFSPMCHHTYMLLLAIKIH